MKQENLFNKEDVIYSYTTKEAEEDGILINVKEILEQPIFSHITNNLFVDYGLENAGQNLKANLKDLFNQAFNIMRKEAIKTRETEFFSGKIENMNGAKTKIFICKNETGCFTLMLPKDY